ncbi:unnamed protein product [Prorocentrum cordatum]|uniref:Geranylgeranyl transferase type II subunit alpha n=1 Tax=Prorocentrum cordatum TaxID=2364126 RepID=A0ABN9Y633_9DINO|nr:unnamed protein product [Polarella glacialis]
MSAWLAHLSEMFRADPHIDEYEVLPQVSAALFGSPDGDAADRGCLCMEHKLAISAEAALVIYRHAYRAMLAARAARGPAADEAAGLAALEAASRAVLLCSADCAEGWACREETPSLNHRAESELRFSSLVLRTNHKSGEAWAFRRHLLSSSWGALPAEGALQLLTTEVSFVEEVAKRYEHHYYAWNHWAWLQLVGGPPSRGLAQGFPELARATPSHYGPFHHRVVRLRELLSPPSAGRGAVRAAHGPQGEPGEENAAPRSEERRGEPGEPSAQRLSLAPPGLDAYAAERRLAASLLATLPHLEAPWAFLLQLFAALLEAAEAAGGGRPSAAAVDGLADVWRSEMAFAADRLGSCEAHLLQELALSLRLWQGTPAAAAPPAGGAHGGPQRACGPELVAEALATLGVLEAERAAAPAVLASVRGDLTRLGAAA